MKPLISAIVATLILACDPRRVVRTIVHSDRISDECIGKTFEGNPRWRLQRDPEASFSVYSRNGRVFGFNLWRNSIQSHEVLQIETALITGKPDESHVLREIESAERAVAVEIATMCAPAATFSCWDSKSQAESARCFP